MAACKLAVLISGRGSNLQALIEALSRQNIPADICVVASNRPDASGLEIARNAGIETCVIDHAEFDSRNSFDQAMMRALDSFQPDLIVLAGFMRILSDEFIDHYAGRIMNIHPSLLPDLKGLNTHQRALDAGYSQHGASVHFVNSELDSGTVVLQAIIDINETDDAETLAARVLQQEHIIYPMAIKWFAENRLRCDNDDVLLDNTPLLRPYIWRHDSLTQD